MFFLCPEGKKLGLPTLCEESPIYGKFFIYEKFFEYMSKNLSKDKIDINQKINILKVLDVMAHDTKASDEQHKIVCKCANIIEGDMRVEFPHLCKDIDLYLQQPKETKIQLWEVLLKCLISFPNNVRISDPSFVRSKLRRIVDDLIQGNVGCAQSEVTRKRPSEQSEATPWSKIWL